MDAAKLEVIGRRSLELIAKRRVGDVYSSINKGYHAEDRPDNAARIATGTATLLIQLHARDFFLSILKSFSMTSKERALMEAGARFFNVRSKRVSMPGHGWIEKFHDYHDKLAGMFSVGLQVVLRGDACRDDQFCTARCFRIVNTGGFPLPTIRAVQKVVDRAAELLDDHGFGVLCYGDMNVTQTVAGSSRVLAFYTPNNDSMYIRANLRGVEGAALETIVHELGHRLDHVFVTAQRRAPISALYRRYKRDNDDAQRVEGGAEPVVGEIFVQKRKNATGIPWTIASVSSGIVYLRLESPETGRGVGAKLSVDAFRRLTGGRNVGGLFPSEYSKKNVEEFFAEMFAGYVIGTLTATQRADFEPIVAPYRKSFAPPGSIRGRARARRTIRL